MKEPIETQMADFLLDTHWVVGRGGPLEAVPVSPPGGTRSRGDGRSDSERDNRCEMHEERMQTGRTDGGCRERLI